MLNELGFIQLNRVIKSALIEKLGSRLDQSISLVTVFDAIDRNSASLYHNLIIHIDDE